MNLLKNKFFIWLIILSISLSFAPLRVAYAMDAVSSLWDVVTGSLTFALNLAVEIVDVSISVTNTLANLPIGITENFIGSVTGISFFGDDGNCRLANLGGGPVELYSGRCDNSGVSFAMITSSQNVCSFKLENTFYIPQMNISYYLGNEATLNAAGNPYFSVVTSWDPENPQSADIEVTNNNRRYQDASCGVQDSSGVYYKPDSDYMNGFYVGSGTCQTLVHSSAYLPIPNFSETDRQIAIYRFTLPADSDQATLNNWFANADPIRIKVGGGWLDLSSGFYYQADPRWTESAPYKTIPYTLVSTSDNWCQGNVCRFVDTDVPNNVYVAYVAKILGNYTTNYDNGQGTSMSASDKFLNNDNSAVTAFPYTTLGNAIVGPLKTGTAVCPKYICSGSSCVQDDVNGTFTTSNCDNTCAASEPAPTTDTPPVSCTSAENACGATNTGTIVGGVCNASAPSNSTCNGVPCASTPNACGQTNGAYNASGVCVPPDNSGCSGVSCTSTPNACGQTNGAYNASGVCVPPANSCQKTITVTNSGEDSSGTITSNPVGINCGSTCSASYSYGASIALTATPSAGYLFDSWSGDCSGAGACEITMDAAKTATANFTAKTLVVSLSASPSAGSGSLTSTLTATVSGTAIGTINYKFYCDRNGNGTNITQPVSGTYDGQAAATQSHTCAYSSLGTFYPKVIVERDNSVPNATDNQTVTVSSQANQAPVPIGLSASQPNYCVAGPAATFNWTFSDPNAGDTQGAYQIQVATTPGFSGPSMILDSGKISSVSNSYYSGIGQLSYNDTYYWRVRVWDNNDSAGAWANGSTVTTPKHVYPTVNFRVLPLNPSTDEVVQFTDLTTGGAAITGWTWSIPDAVYQSGTNANSQNPKVKFTSAGNKVVNLIGRDADNYQCSNADTGSSLQSVMISLHLPGWKEIAP